MTKKIVSKLNRRQFLRHLGVGASASLLASQSMVNALANDDLLKMSYRLQSLGLSRHLSS